MTKFLVLTVALFMAHLSFAALPDSLPPGNYDSHPHTLKVFTAKEITRREQALAIAKVWQQPEIPIGSANLLETRGNEQFKNDAEVVCKFDPGHEYGTGRTKKFYCTLPSGQSIKVKYANKPDGSDNREVRSEVVGSRLLTALGFGADGDYMPHVVRCFGCPKDPFKKTQATSFDQYTDFTHVAIDIKLVGTNMEAKDAQGWSFKELSKISTDQGHSTLAEVDGLRLLVAFLQNGDTKSANQTLVCLPGALREDESTCMTPIAYMSDLGCMFGGQDQVKFDVKAWASTNVWADASCKVAQPAEPPFSGPTFKGAVISEEGRVFLLSLMKQLSRGQIEDLFRGVRLDEIQVKAWADEFERRVRYLDASDLKCKHGSQN
jgi:hypothetical protein